MRVKVCLLVLSIFLLFSCENGMNLLPSGSEKNPGGDPSVENPGTAPDEGGSQVFSVSLDKNGDLPEGVKFTPLTGKVAAFSDENGGGVTVNFTLSFKNLVKDVTAPTPEQPEPPVQSENAAFSAAAQVRSANPGDITVSVAGYEAGSGEDKQFASAQINSGTSAVVSVDNPDARLTITLKDAKLNHSGEIKLKLTYSGVVYKKSNLTEIIIYVAGKGSFKRTPVVLSSVDAAIGNRAKVIDNNFLTLDDSVASQSLAAYTADCLINLGGVVAEHPLKMRLETESGVTVNIVQGNIISNQVPVGVTLPAPQSVSSETGSFKLVIEDAEGGSGSFYSGLPIYVNMQTMRQPKKGTREIKAAVTSDQANELSGSGVSYDTTYYDVKRAAAADVKDVTFRVALSELAAGQNLTLTAAKPEGWNVSFDRTELNSTNPSALVTVTVPSRADALTNTQGSVTIKVDGYSLTGAYNPFEYDYDKAAKQITVDVTRTAPPLDSIAFIKAVKGKTFIDNPARNKLLLYRYVVSGDGNTIIYRQVTWQPGPAASYPVSDIKKYTFDDAESISSSAAVYTSGSEKVTFSVAGTKLSRNETAAGDSAVSDNGPTFVERVAGRTYKQTGDKVIFNFSADGQTLEYSDKYGVFGATRKYTYKYNTFDTGDITIVVFESGRYWKIGLFDDGTYVKGTSGDGITAYEAVNIRVFDDKYGANLIP